MSSYKSFAVLGAGNLGKLIVEELLRAKAAGGISTVLVVSRSAGLPPMPSEVETDLYKLCTGGRKLGMESTRRKIRHCRLRLCGILYLRFHQYRRRY